jgi:hypothetical protein
MKINNSSHKKRKTDSQNRLDLNGFCGYNKRRKADLDDT